MSLTESKRELENFLEQPQYKECKVVVMPDFFLDRLISVPWVVEEFPGIIADVVKHKGGSLDGVPQTNLNGGNAINVASALSSLGIGVKPIICTSDYGLEQIKYHFKSSQIDLSHIKKCGKASITTALEFNRDNEKINVMIRDLGALAEFSSADLAEEDYTWIEAADYVCLFNWAGTLKHGTSLAQAVFERTKHWGRGKTYYDTADPTPNTEGIPNLIEEILKTSKVDILSLNENEAVTYASQLDNGIKEKQGRIGFAELAMEAARVLARAFSARIDLHTTVFSATLKGTSEVVVPSFKIKVQRATGAGDAWNAGNIIADHNGLSDECRLILANAVSACYLSGADGSHPNKDKLASFIKANI